MNDILGYQGKKVVITGAASGMGQAAAQLNTLGPLHPSSVGMMMHFAFTLYAPFDFVSEAVEIEIVETPSVNMRWKLVKGNTDFEQVGRTLLLRARVPALDTKIVQYQLRLHQPDL